MNKLLTLILSLAVTCLFSCRSPSSQSPGDWAADTVWNIDNLESVGGKETIVLGSPKVIETARGGAVEFDGVGDGLIVEDLPLAAAEEFTLEIIFWPDAKGLKEQRFLHLQERASESRILIETRLTEDDRWYLDTYIHSPKGSKALFDPAKTHAVGKWYNATLVYDGQEMRHYVNDVKEMSGDLDFSPLGEGKTSIGVRMNRVFWFKGAIQKVRFTRRALHPQQFLKP
ncbi:MAG: LamG-like jellyroll fold domain-containing protein [Planctomycetota bacterium]